MKVNLTYQGNVLYILPQLESNSVDCIVTSPPYWQLRNYGIEGQIGLEPTPAEFIQKMTAVFSECLRILKPTGTCWINIGDSYSSGGRGYSSRKHSFREDMGWKGAPAGFKRKELIGIPWRLAFALQDSGWYLRQDIIWYKKNPMPESVTDRCTKSHEYIFLLSKSRKYYFNAKAIATPYADKTYTTFGIPFKETHGDGSGLIFAENRSNSQIERKPKVWKTPDGWDTGKGSHGSFHRDGREKGSEYMPNRTPRPGIDSRVGNQGNGGIPVGDGLANRRSVWEIATRPFADAHFATFPEELPELCIKAGCPEEGIVLDPFSGSGTTGIVARKLNRKYIGIELNPDYIAIENKRKHQELGLLQ